MLTEPQWHRLFPDAHADILQPFIDQSDRLALENGVAASKEHMAIFLGEVGHESGGMTIREENLNYRAERLMQVWPSRFPTISAADPYAHNPRLLAEHVYGGRMGNRPEGAGDGWAYRGQCPIQITGHDDYAAVEAACDLPLVARPDLATDPRNGVVITFGFWKWKKINEAISAATSFEAAIHRATVLINGGTIGLSSRIDWINRALAVLGEDAAASNAPAPAAPVVVRLHSRGAAVARLQQLLNSHGAGIRVDGDAGPATVAAIIHFQDTNGLQADGVAGSSTWAALARAVLPIGIAA